MDTKKINPVAIATVARPGVAALNPTLTGYASLMVNFISISRDDPLGFRFSDRDAIPHNFEARILGGKPRFAAKHKDTKEWKNFPDNDSMQEFVDEHSDWQAVKRYILALRLPGVNESYVFDLPFTSSIAFWTYAEGLAKEGVPVADVLTGFSIERVAQRSDPSVKYSRVAFAASRPLTEDEKATMGVAAVKGIAAEEDEAEVPWEDSAPTEADIRAANVMAYNEYAVLPLGVTKEGKPMPVSQAKWDKKCVDKWGHLYETPIEGFSDLSVEHQAEMLGLMRDLALAQGLSIP